MGIIAAILQIVQAADAALGSEVGDRLLAFLVKDRGLTPAQAESVMANRADYRARIARLDAEIAASTSDADAPTKLDA